MKQKLLIAGLCACMMATMAGCGNKDEATTEPSAGTAAVPPEAQQAQSQAQEKARADAAARSANAPGASGTTR